MAWETTKDGENEKIYYVDNDDPTKKSLVFDVDKINQKIIFYPKQGSFFLKEISLSGFCDVPEEILKSGTLRGGLLYFLNDRFATKKVLSFEISNHEKSSIKQTAKGKKVVFSFSDTETLVRKLGSIYYEAKIERGEYVDAFLYNTYPNNFLKSDVIKAARNKTRRLLKNLESDTIGQLKSSEAQRVVDYFIELVEKRSTQQKFFNLAKLKIDEISLDSVIDKIKLYISNNSVENDWSNFLIENLFVVDSKYTYAIPEINLTLGGSRRVDFGLIDSDGYLDIFEIKRPNTKIFEKTPDHGNYYWHKNAVQAIVQAEKY